MRSAVIGFVAGAGLLQMQASLPAFSVMIALFAIAAVLAMSARYLRVRGAGSLSMLACGACLGFCWAAFVAHHALSEQLPTEWEGRDITVTGTVESLPSRFEGGERFDFAVERVEADSASPPKVPSRVSLALYAPPHAGGGSPEVAPGERWQFNIRLQRPHGNANPYGFDYEVWLLEQDIRATGYVREDAVSANRRLDAFVPGVHHAVERLRAALRDRIDAALPGKPYAGVIVALVVGDQRAIDEFEWKVFSRTGVSHLMSISGLHITMVAGLFAAAVFGLWRRSFFTSWELPTLLPAQKAAALAGALAALAYVALAGFGVPAQRTLYMLSVVAWALWTGRIANISHVLCAALGLAVLLDPWAVLWPGFWLSFGAVAIILYATAGRAASFQAASESGGRRWLAGLKSAAHTQYVVTLGLVPLTMLLFSQVSLAGPLANAVAIPLVSFVITPLALLGSVMPAPLSDWMLHFAHWLLACLASLLEWLSASPLAAWNFPQPSAWMFVSGMAGMLWMLAPRGWPLRWIGAAGLLPMLLNVSWHPANGEMRVTAFDVGQGMALLVETGHHRLLYDTGPAYSPESDGGNRVILPYLKARGIASLDGMVVSHQDSDHSGGALSILGQTDIGWVLSSLPLSHPIVLAAHDHRRCIAGQAWEWDGVRFEILHPEVVSYDSDKWKPNARSCTLKITDGGQSLLLAGDIEAVQETELVEGQAEKLRANVLLAPHHGSGTSSTLPFLEAVHPDVALFQVGYRNRYHHPKQEIYERYGQLGIERIRTDQSGAVVLDFGNRMALEQYRDAHARYWYGR